jgi:hypothetical protein
MQYIAPPKASKARRVMINFIVLCLLIIGLIQLFWSRWKNRKPRPAASLDHFHIEKAKEYGLSNGCLSIHLHPEGDKSILYRKDCMTRDEIVDFTMRALGQHQLLTYSPYAWFGYQRVEVVLFIQNGWASWSVTETFLIKKPKG